MKLLLVEANYYQYEETHIAIVSSAHFKINVVFMLLIYIYNSNFVCIYKPKFCILRILCS